ncbi:MAG TPA: RagB/SusD family nutrient uptake outer membrane protein, partial [Chitinophaga sp.]|nr:RagB/SusD family nutrient uptake outer membrane protein [Chitinophaga sp.]
MIHIKIAGGIFLIAIILQACSLITADVPLDKAAGRQVFENADSAVAAITGIYEGFASTTNFFYGGASVYAGIYTDELVYIGRSVPLVEFSNSTLTSSNTTLETIFWKNSYYFIYRVNSCIEGLAASQAIGAPLRDQLMGEAKFLRALLYFYLIHYFDEVPLLTTTDQSINERMARTPIAMVKEAILADLLAARQLLSPAYPTSERARVNKWCVAALLA